MKVTDKGQVTIPPELRKRHGLLPRHEVEFVDQPDGVLVVKAGKAFEKYRRAGGKKARPLPDFFIGAHAYVAHLPLLTRDTRCVRTFFPSVQLTHRDRIPGS